MKICERNKKCWEAELDTYCDDLHKNKKLHEDTLKLIKKIFKEFPDLKKKFPILQKEINKKLI